jgi:hypothetical protein
LSCSGGIWIVSFELLLSLLKILEGFGLPSTLASVTGGVAGDKLLLSEGKELSSLKEMSTFKSAGG